MKKPSRYTLCSGCQSVGFGVFFPIMNSPAGMRTMSGRISCAIRMDPDSRNNTVNWILCFIAWNVKYENLVTGNGPASCTVASLKLFIAELAQGNQEEQH